jgi:microcystin-dependent protein
MADKKISQLTPITGASLVSDDEFVVVDTSADETKSITYSELSGLFATSAQGALADSAVQPNDSPTFGSVTVTGTVDGRDIASDGTKLDGIEAGADVTDTANVTAAGALMDSEVVNLAQVKAFDSSDYATAAQGALADSATQPGDLATVATSGSYNDLSDKPTISAGYTDSDVDAHLNYSTATTGQVLSYSGSDYDWVDFEGAVPTSTVIYVAQNTAPTGYLKANGAAISRTTYADLFAAIGTTFGSGDGSTTFNVPDLRGEFVRGWDDARGVDSGRSFGSAQSDQVGEHDHGFVDGRSYIVPRSVAASGRAFGTGAQDSGVVFDALTGQETRPTNVALLACIKY